ncbi:MAG: asparaginase, partial [Ilumatobacteraceae bacterium]
PVAMTTRSGQDESVHFGAVVVLARDGSVERAHGNPDALVYPRSSNKPMQAVAMVRAGLELPPELLALVCASHDGLPMHRDGALRILASAGLGAEALANTADLPLDPDESERILRGGGTRTPLQMNCSGKHSGMLATCVHNGWSHDASYLDPDHPLQQRITDTIVELSAEPAAPVGIDGCGAPAHMMTLAGLARSFRAIAVGEAGDAGRSVYAAMTGHPQMVGGPQRDVTAFIEEVPGLMAKDGAEGVFAAALPDGRAIALKIADGANRARPPLMVAALGWLGIDTTVLAARVAEPIRGHGQIVGTVRSLLV